MMRMRLGMCVLSVIVLVSVTGCPDSRTSNQGGGSILTVVSKLTSNVDDPPIGQLNPDEWQIIADNLPQLLEMLGITPPEGTTIPDIVLTDQQAQDIVDFLTTYEVNNASELAVLAEQVISGELEIEIPPSLLELAESFQEETA